MEIHGVNETHTKHSNEVGFDIAGDIDINIVNKLNSPHGVSYIYKNGVLVIKSQHNPVNYSHAESFIAEYLRQKRVVERAAEDAENNRQASLRSICKNVGYNLTRDGGGRL